MKNLDYKKLFDIGARITLSSDFLSRTYSSGSWEQDCINVQTKCGSLKIKHVYPDSILVEGTRDNWILKLSNINLYQLEFYKDNPEILYAFTDNQAQLRRKRNISCPLNVAFVWETSKEGDKFWRNIYENKKINSSETKESQQTTQNNNNHEIRLQKQKALVVRGTRPEGNRICSSKHKASIRSGQISYTACHC